MSYDIGDLAIQSLLPALVRAEVLVLLSDFN